MINEHYLGAKFKTGKTVQHGFDVYYIRVISDEGHLLSYHTFMSKEAVLHKLNEIRFELQKLVRDMQNEKPND